MSQTITKAATVALVWLGWAACSTVAALLIGPVLGALAGLAVFHAAAEMTGDIIRGS